MAVSGLILRWKAKELCSDPEFKASLGWYQNWKKRHAISFRTKTTLAQRLPQDLEEKTIQFHRFVIAARQHRGYSLSRIFNMDETPMRFELPSSRTLEFSGSRTVPVKSCGAEKRSFTVTLRWHSQSPPMVANYRLQWSSKVYELHETSLFQTLFVYRSTRRAGWMRKVNYGCVSFFTSKSVILR